MPCAERRPPRGFGPLVSVGGEGKYKEAKDNDFFMKVSNLKRGAGKRAIKRFNSDSKFFDFVAVEGVWN